MHDRWVSLAAVCFSLVATSVWAASGRPDPTFGVGGIVVAPVLEYSDALALVRQPDGAVVAGGAAGQTGFPYLRDMLLARFAADGSPDATFGTDGVVLTPIAGRRSVARRVLLQPDGKLVAVGSLDEDYTGSDVVLARFDAAGVLDPSFGSGGIVTVDLGARTRAWDAALQSDGGIVVAGIIAGAGVPGGQDGLVLRVDTTGALDPSFGTGGVVTLDVAGQYDEVQDVLLVPGRILVAGWAADPLVPFGGVRTGVITALLLGDGSVDPTFGTGGIAQVSVDSRTYVRTMVRLSDGDIYAVGGGSADGISGYSFVMRLNADGTPDVGFGGGDGIISPSTGGLVSSLLAMPDDLIFGAGPGFLWGHWGSIGLGRYLPDGSPDPTFGNAGVASLYPDVGDYYNAAAQALVAEPDGSAVTVAGFFSPLPYVQSAQGRQLALARYLVDDTACSLDADCAVCERCGTTGVCERGPRTGCLRPSPYRGAKVLYAGGPVRPKILWKWRSGPALTSFDPTAGDDVALCMWWGRTPLYESTIPAGAGWTASGTGFKYRDRVGSAFGIQQVKITRSTLQVKAVGEAIEDNPNGFVDALLAPGDDSIALEVQLHSSNGACFATTYPQSVLEGKYPQHTRSGLGY